MLETVEQNIQIALPHIVRSQANHQEQQDDS